MMRDQLIPALIGQLLREGVAAEQIEKAVARVRDLRLGQSITGGESPERRAFVFEQTDRLLDVTQSSRVGRGQDEDG
jgi:hypothetical protein